LEEKHSESRKDAIELLAFISMVKSAQPNSVLFETAYYKMAAKMGMGDSRTFKKYLVKCIDAGLCQKQIQKYNTSNTRVVYAFISYNDAVTRLLGVKKAQLRFFPKHRNLGKFKNYQHHIELDLAGLNYAQQAYRSKSNFPNKINIINEINRLNKLPVSEKNTRYIKSLRSKLIKKLRTADIRAKESSVKNHCKDVVTGCRHLAGLIGKSNTTGARRLTKWIQSEYIKVHDVIQFTPTSSRKEAEHVIATLIAARKKGIHVYSSKEHGVKSIQGKIVLEFNGGCR
jgi:hypothetical protein